MERDNYYLLLGLPLDPPEEDPETIDAVVTARTDEWKKRINSPAGLTYMYYLEQVPGIRKYLLEDDESRLNRTKEITDASRTVMKQLSEMIAAVSAKGYVTEGEIAKISNMTVTPYSTKLSVFLTPETIRKRIPVPVGEASETFTPPAPPQTDPGTRPMDMLKMKHFQSLLSIVRKKDLYDVLGCSPADPIQVLQQNAKDIVEIIRKQKKKSVWSSATQELAGNAFYLFSNEAGKKAYDLALKNFQSEIHLMRLFELRIDDKQKKVTCFDYIQSIMDAQEIGRMTRQEAEYFVYKFFCLSKKLKYPVPPG